MPNYVTHEVMGELIDIPNSRVDLDKKLLSAFSVGHDLMFSVNGAISETHNTKTRDFFYTLINYIIDNKLYDDASVMAFLYGSIMHYQLDKTVHPYIYYMTNGVPKSRIVNFHMASEEFLGNFILKNKISLSRKDISSNLNSISKIDNDSMVSAVVDDVYSKVYGFHNSMSSVKKTVIYLKALEIFKELIKEDKKLAYYNFIGFEHYLNVSDMCIDTLTNVKKDIWFDPISKKKRSESFLELFDESLYSSQDVIEKVNDVIYGNKDISCLDSIFVDDSYDTGLPCDIGKPFVKSRYKDFCNK